MEKVLRNYLMASPYSNRTNLNGELTEKVFYEKYFQHMPVFNEAQEKINEEFGRLGTDCCTFFLHGYAGIGKTTFLFWYLKNNLKKYNKIIFNIIDVDTDEDDKEGVLPIFDRYFTDVLFSLNHHFPNYFDSTLSYIKSMIDIMENKFSQLFLDKLLDCNINEKDAKRKFINTIKYQDSLLLFLLFYKLNPTTDFKQIDCLNYIPHTDSVNSFQNFPLIVAFDNIDHIEIESHNCDFPKKIKRTIDNCSKIVNHQPQIHSIFCLRDANFSLVNRQLEEIVKSKPIPLKPIEYEKVIEKRIDIAKEDKIDIDIRQTQFIKKMFPIPNPNLNPQHTRKVEPYTRIHFMPLFNFNYRKLINFIIDTPLELEKKDLDLIDQLYSDTRSIHGGRGIIYFWLIKLLRSKDFLRQTLLVDDKNIPEAGKVESGSMNPSRMILTILHNINKSCLDKETGEFQILDRPSTLYELFSIYGEMFTKDTKGEYFFHILTRLFLCHRDNFSHLISFTNKEIFNENPFDEEQESLEIAKCNHNNELKVKIAKDKLDKIKIQINPSGFSYLNDIIRHYEFFSLVKANNTKPLFCCLNLDRYNNPEFLINIDKTFLKAKECVEELNEFISMFGSVSSFQSSNYCFKIYKPEEDESDGEVVGSPRLYLIRIIHSHIQYIDTLRYCVQELDILKEFFISKGLTDNEQRLWMLKNRIKLSILDRISKYVNLLPEYDEKYSNEKVHLQDRVEFERGSREYKPIIIDK